jgi:membrane-bound serine protease (ClpP class)
LKQRCKIVPWAISLRRIRSFLFASIWLVGIFAVFIAPVFAQTGQGGVYVLNVEGVINPPIASYVERGLEQANARGAKLIVLQMDTPGGLDTSMRVIIQAILASPAPVAVYVTPPGARAASAGLFLLMASHIAVMAPNTNTGSAHPVGLGGETDEVMTAKVVEDAAATIRTLATERGRNAEWAERAVRESVSVTEQEALEENVIDLVAVDLTDLLRQLQGRQVKTATGEVVLDLEGALVEDLDMTFAERLLHVISDPNVAFILLSVGSIGLLAELYNPGAFFPGIAGVISLILAFYSLGNLPTNYAGVALIVLAIALTVAELYIEGFGVLGVGALVAFVLGALILFRPFTIPSPVLPEVRVHPLVITLVTASMAGFLVLVLTQVVRARRSPVKMGSEYYLGQIVRVHSDLNPRGRVWFEGQTWYAELVEGSREVAAGEKVRIVGLDGLTLIVKPVNPDLPAGEQTGPG